jgi:hypothetical protein
MQKTKMVALALVAPALALSACGGGDKGSSDKSQITDIINSVATNPAKLCDVASAGLLKQAFAGSVKDCKTAAADQKGSGKATINSLDVSGDKATVKLTDKDGHSTVSFAKVDGDWKVTASN